MIAQVSLSTALITKPIIKSFGLNYGSTQMALYKNKLVFFSAKINAKDSAKLMLLCCKINQLFLFLRPKNQFDGEKKISNDFKMLMNILTDFLLSKGTVSNSRILFSKSSSSSIIKSSSSIINISSFGFTFSLFSDPFFGDDTVVAAFFGDTIFGAAFFGDIVFCGSFFGDAFFSVSFFGDAFLWVSFDSLFSR